jgi:hypothetical protein
MEDPTEEHGLRPPGAAHDLGSEAAADQAYMAPGERGPAGGERESLTGEPRVDAALARLDELEELPVTEHRAVFEDVHQRLRDVLGELDAGQSPPGGHASAPAARPGW